MNKFAPAVSTYGRDQVMELAGQSATKEYELNLPAFFSRLRLWRTWVIFVSAAQSPLNP